MQVPNDMIVNPSRTGSTQPAVPLLQLSRMTPILVTIRPIPMKTTTTRRGVLCECIRKTILTWKRPCPGVAIRALPILLFKSLSLALTFTLSGIAATAQPIYTVDYGDLNFFDASKTHKSGNKGETAGSKTLYTNVLTVGGKTVDCIVTTESITNGYFLLPTEPCPNTIPFDYKDVSNCPPGSLTGNQDRFFSPMLYFNSGGGSVKFKFEFIQGGSYDNTTHRGQPVILKNVMINSYDIDGNSNCGAPNASLNQYNDFSGFNAAARATPGSNIFPTYNTATGMTRFMSTSNCNMRDVMDPSTRIRVEYNYIQEFEVVMGMTGQGRAFYMLDFGPGPYWIPQYLGGNTLDLNTNTDSYNNSGAFCTVPVKLTAGTGNVSGTGNAINDFFMTFASIDIVDGNSEYLTTDLNNPSAHIRLGSPFTGSQSFSVAGISYTAYKSESAGYRTMRIARTDGKTMTEAQGEALIDAFHYFNSANSVGIRRFRIWYREGTTTSTFGFFELYGGCMILQARTTDFTASLNGQDAEIKWRTEDIGDIAAFSLERAAEGSAWEEVHFFPVEEEKAPYIRKHTDRPVGAKGIVQYRLIEHYRDGRKGLSPVRVVRFGYGENPTLPYPNPVVDGKINVTLNEPGMVTVLDLSMRTVWQKSLETGRHRLDLGALPKGVYLLRSGGRTHRIVVQTNTP